MASSVLSEKKGGHRYEKNYTSDCAFNCGCWSGDTRSGGPDGVDPLGKCPNNPKNKKEGSDVKVLTAKNLIGKKLDGFTIQEYTEVYKVDVEGRSKESTLGYFKNDNIAQGFAGKQTDAGWHKTNKVLLLTDGKTGFLIGDSVKLLDDEKAALEVRQAALAKLTPAERALLKL